MYKGYYAISIRDFKQACALFLDTVSTFTSTELMEYKDFVALTVFVALPILSRPDLYKKVG